MSEQQVLKIELDPDDPEPQKTIKELLASGANTTDYQSTPVRGDHVEVVVKLLLEYFKCDIGDAVIPVYRHSEPHLHLMDKMHETGNLTVAEALFVCERFEYITKKALSAEVRRMPSTNTPGIVFRVRTSA